jgi:hypothetical protein
MLDVDEFDARRLTVLNVAGVALIVAIVVWALHAVVTDVLAAGSLAGVDLTPLLLAVGALVFGAIGLYGSTEPDYEGYCDACGDPLRANDRTDETEVYLRRAVRHPPKRVSVLGHSFVTRTRSYEVFYCSDACAAEDPLDHGQTVRADPLDEAEGPVDEIGDAEVSD